MRARVAMLSLVVACGRLGFNTDIAPSHVRTGFSWSTGDVVLTSGVIDTSALTIGGAAGNFTVVEQQPSGPQLAVLSASSITIAAGTVVSVAGGRPLVIAARDAITIEGTLDASAIVDRAGPGARATTAIGGLHTMNDVCDSGGGGGGNATPGGVGGIGTLCGVATPSTGGMIEGDDVLSVLAGGSAGAPGVSNACGIPPGGGGGGAIQLSAGAITIVGQLLAGGGGGTGGPECGDGDAGAGAGGGAGGSIFIEARDLAIDGLVIAHGGGGGGGGNGQTQNGPIGGGGTGADGRTLGPAAGGTVPAPNAGVGGTGGGDGIDPTQGGDCDHNAGGGGGAAGRIVVYATSIHGVGTISPAPRR